VESDGGVGSIFRFGIPATKVQAHKEVEQTSSLKSLMSRSVRPSSSAGIPKSSPSSTPSPPPNNNTVQEHLHVLVVEDNLVNQRVLQRQLTLKGFLVTVANNGLEALTILQDPRPSQAPISLILADIEMPVKDGITTIRELRELESSGEVPKRFPAIAVTGNARQGQIDACRAAGFDDVAIKPYKVNELLDMIRKVTGKGPTL